MDNKTRSALWAACKVHGIKPVATDIGVSTEALARYLAKLPVMKGTRMMIEVWATANAHTWRPA